MPTSLSPEIVERAYTLLHTAHREFASFYPGESDTRQPVHTMYGGAQIFKADTARKLGMVGLNALLEYAPTFVDLARVLDFPGNRTLPVSRAQITALTKRVQANPSGVRATNEPAWLAFTVYDRIITKLKDEPVEDFRIDFEDGYGNRSESEEDGHAASTAVEVARGMTDRTLPPFIGIRVKPFTEDLKSRGIRTLDIFLSTLLQQTGGKLPDNFIVTIPKVVMPGQVKVLAELLGEIEKRNGLANGALQLELMIETPQSLFNAQGEAALPLLVAASQGRCKSAHFGVYDYTASCGITATFQQMTHPACDFARHMMKTTLAGTGIWLSDGATNVMPVGHHRAVKGGTPLTARQKKENRDVVHGAWRLGFDDINHSLMNGFYQGWDLHPAQLPIRYAAVYLFFLRSLDDASMRLRTFVEKAAQATLIGSVFDDAATGQGLLNFFLKGIGCRAITEDEARATGLSLEEIRSRSFLKILQGRRGAH
jgi:hypothetical protein